jgi:hypothetical protein
MIRRPWYHRLHRTDTTADIALTFWHGMIAGAVALGLVEVVGFYVMHKR